MTLSEIETTLEELAIRHPNLDTALLSTLLYSSGWDEKTIKEALLLFAQKKPNNTSVTVPTEAVGAPVVSGVVQNQSIQPTSTVTDVPMVLPKEGITFYQPDGSEEGELHAFADGVIAKKEEKITTPDVIQKKEVAPAEVKEEKQPEKLPEQKIDTTPVPGELEKNVIVATPLENVASPVIIPAPFVAPIAKRVESLSAKDPESLILRNDVPEKKPRDAVVEIPGNLPLLPFESSPHIWSFSHYKDIFHGGAPLKEEIKVISVMPEEQKQPEVVFQKPIQEKLKIQKVTPDVEVSIDKIPYNREDGSLVFLAGVMLFVIIMILGYMYSNGRL